MKFFINAFFFLLVLTSSAFADDVVIGNACPTLGVTTISTDRQSIAACLEDKTGNLIWKSTTGGQEGTPAGIIAFFALAKCPDGWSMANGSNGTLDVRGEFLRAWDGGRGVDAGRALGSAQGDAIRNISGSSQTIVSANQSDAVAGFVGNTTRWSTNVGWWAGSGPGYTAGLTFDASRVVPTANENRPRNIALLVCEKL